ncbi:MAG: FkbM family methyltransferase [Ignavibacteriales bacterium]|nr:FkbM family methyltransferase [Ignavibacteriales bacterium]
MAETTLNRIAVLIKLAITEPQVVQALISQRVSGFLFEEGWFESFKTKSSVNKDGQPIPWFSYPCISFLEPRLTQDMHILEFGAGNSTIYFSTRVKTVDSIEHHEGWFQHLKQRLPHNASLWYAPEKPVEKYAMAGNTCGRTFDIIIIDAIERVESLKTSFPLLNETGVMILDDSERAEYDEAHLFMKQKGYRQIDFWGMAPEVTLKKCTTIFYKPGNCLNI